MLYLIHGDQNEAARNKLNELKAEQNATDGRVLHGKSFDPTQLTQALESSSLFGGSVLIVIEHLIASAKKREKSFSATLQKIVEASKSADIILYEEKEVDKTTLTKLGSSINTYLYKAPATLFQFLDGLVPDRSAETLGLFRTTVASVAPEVVYTLLTRRIRHLIQLSDGVSPEGLQGWQAGRLTSQARHFTMDKLVSMHMSLLKIDITVKTGATPYSLTQLLEQFIVHL